MHSPLALVRDPTADTDTSPRAAEPFDALEHLVGVNLARLRAERQLSLDALARASGVSRAMLAQIESARSVPSIKVLCKVAAALKVSVAAFLRRHATNGFEHLPAERSSRVVSSNGRYSARPLYPDAEPTAAEFHELRIAPLHTEAGTRRAPGTTVNLVVSEGTLEVSVHDQRQLLATGDAIVFDADQPHSLRNPGDTEARAFRVTLKAETPPRWDVQAHHEPAREAAPV
ncbi:MULTISPECIES: XRE family transcriptional regulator [unclassified Paraburkholderia]|uniref:helix-turn-helix domain-containing protein n=1 Tax=unclassified Paraburkholderia TaxID=2615204 RepID=UPI000E26E3DD|nr:MULTISPECIES: XRE family transcriptional regulator [unclassified Paraburkholderia]REE17279.1 XRE family transcriptional regulator [Paraburkholderia sp. BL27I4N3]RKR44251.1 XRE family transcriptional regulator [Paraburkholderia sp. BL17N1]TDY24182.1 XRE family transcriptional regulator [Paraburkholderia sp. BL6665CI2N2]